jgi:PAS domain S-box-containing protein
VASGKCILVVDDDPVQLKLTRIHFEQLGYDVVTATNAQDALRLARTRVPDMIVSDVLMPSTDGFQLCLEARRDRQLEKIPVVLLSAWYQTEADRDLARRVGASAFLQRTPDFEGLDAPALEALGTELPSTEEPTDHLKLEHAKAVIRQLERQLSISSGLLRRCTLQAAQISLLSGIADALANKGDTDVALHDVLAATLDAAGISKGAIFLRASEGGLSLRQWIGFASDEISGLETCFGDEEIFGDVLQRGGATHLRPSAMPESTLCRALLRAEVVSLEVVPLVVEGRSIGAMLLALKATDVTTDEAVAFARAMANQLAHSLELASSFARLAASEQRYRVLTESAHDGICILTPNGVIREANGRLAATLGVARDEMVGRSLADFAAPERKSGYVDAFERAMAAGQGRTPAIEMQRPGGEIVLIEFSLRAIEVSGENLVFAIGRDMTDQARTHAQLLVSDRMASVGTLAAGVAHEINNPLTTVTANLELAARDVDRLGGRLALSVDLGELEAELRDAREGAERVREIVRDLRTFSRGDDERRGAVDVHRVLDSTLRMAHNETRHRAQVVKEYGRVPPVFGSESRLGQVFLNLIVNAAQAIPEGRADLNRIEIRTAIDRFERVVVDVADTGRGMAPDVVKRLFTPFFTTKAIGVGTGLGLAISHRIVTGFGGEITVSSEEGRGTTFHVVLPTAKDALAATAATPMPSVRPPPRRARILVVDDEASVGRTIRRMLGDEHDVETTTDAAEALARIRAGERFDVILCDLMMPIMTGMELYSALASSSSEHAERMVFLTGGAFTPLARDFVDKVQNPHLEKPFALQTLRALVNERLR